MALEGSFGNALRVASQSSFVLTVNEHREEQVNNECKTSNSGVEIPRPLGVGYTTSTDCF